MIGACGTAGCIDSVAVAAIFGAVALAWVLGFGMGKAVAWVRALTYAA